MKTNKNYKQKLFDENMDAMMMDHLNNILNETKVKVDCLTAHYNNLVPKKLHKYWVNKVESYKDSDTWLNEPKGVDDMYYEGRRYNDNDRVVDVILGCMRQQIQQHLFGSIHSEIDESLSAKSFEFYITTIDEKKLNEWINAALHYSAGCDHWYTFEKEW
jgi:hypothetical protein